MRFVRCFVVLAVALCAIPSVSKAQTVLAVGGGSSAIWGEMGQGAATAAATSTPCAWTSGKSSNILARDNRTATPTDEQGNIWVTWSAGSTGTCASPSGTGINIYSSMQLDSVVGDKCYFEVDSSGTPGCVQVLTVADNAPGANKLPGVVDTNLPPIIRNALNGHHFTFGATDIRPEDAKFAVYRLFQPCGTPVYRNPYDLTFRQTYGLGYQTGTAGVGVKIHSAVSGAIFNVLDFNISGTDPFTGNSVPSYQVNALGAQPIVVVVAPAGGSGIGAANDINGFTLSLFYEGVLARSTDLVGPTTVNPVITLVREPLSGTYNTFEYSMPNGSQFHTSQDDNFCDGSGHVYSDTMNITSSTGTVPGAKRERVIGTGEMVATLQAASTDTLGYSFWSQSNFNGFTNGKYLTVNGVDPLLDRYGHSGATDYTPGALPQAVPPAGVPPLSAITFKNLNAGDYPIWSAVRVVGIPSDPGLANLVSASHTLDSTQHDYIALSNLKVWHSHFAIYPIGVTNQANGNTINTANDLCPGGSAENGGDAGGTNVSLQVNYDFCSDYSVPAGLINKTN